MFQLDACIRQDDSMDYTNILNVDVISKIEKELLHSPYDMSSLVFLLYDVPDTALQHLTVYQRVYQNAGSMNMNLLHEWWQYAKSKPNWQHEFIEALLICQLYSIVRKLGLDQYAIKKHYQPDNVHVCMYINPLKKALFKLCDNINHDNLLKLKEALLSYKIDTSQYELCELVFLKLMCVKFITMKQYQYDCKVLRYQFEIDNLLKIIECLPGLQTLSLELRDVQNIANTSSSPPMTTEGTVAVQPEIEVNSNDLYKSLFQMLNELSVEEEEVHYKTDCKELGSDFYPIKNPKKIGVCIIINQEKFHPSKESIRNGDVIFDRKGSNADKENVSRTMKLLNFDVHSRSNLNNMEIFTFIKSVVKEHVHSDTSIIMVCILSHGVKGHIYASNSVKVKVSSIQDYFDSDELKQARGIPKVFVIQACQVVDTPPPECTFVPDSPDPQFYLAKTDFLVYWATAAEYEAFRNEVHGSIFIHCLCKIITQFSKSETINDMFTRVTDIVTSLCTKLRLAQVPTFGTTLRKKLYLQLPH